MLVKFPLCRATIKDCPYDVALTTGSINFVLLMLVKFPLCRSTIKDCPYDVAPHNGINKFCFINVGEIPIVRGNHKGLPRQNKKPMKNQYDPKITIGVVSDYKIMIIHKEDYIL